ncbi:MAG: HEAT repeat domain-containing protein [Acidobacteria bacterium]|nr:HEAT repeat domain-containing protein [Acidobacteriota bacterium]
MRFLRGIEGAEVTRILLAKLPALTPNGQVRVITALAERGDEAARPAIAEATNAGAAEVRIAALAALGKVGDKTNLMLLAEAAAKRSGAEQEAARESLSTLRGADTDAAILAGMSETSGAVLRELIRATGERAIPNSADRLLSIVGSEQNREVRREALRALRNVGRQDQAAALLELVLKEGSSSDRRDAARTLATVMRRSDTPQIDLVVSAYNKAASAEARTAVLAIMGQASWDETLPVLRQALKDPEPQVCREAILALTEWTNPAPMNDLLEMAKNSASPTHRVLALRGYLRLLAVQAPRTTQESVRLVNDAIPLAKAPEEKKTILSLLARYSSEESLVLAQDWLKDPTVAAEAKYAVDAILTQLEFSRPLKPRK